MLAPPEDAFAQTAANIPITTPSTIIALHAFFKSSSLIFDNTYTDAANTAIAFAKLYIPCVLFSNAAACRFLANPFSTLDTPLNISPSPSSGEPNISNTSVNRLTVYNIPPIITKEKTAPKSIRLIISIIPEAKFCIVENTFSAPLITPLIRP